jgi:hypothetical protein
MGALMFRRRVYAEVQRDRRFTATAWLLVIATGFLSQLGSYGSVDAGQWLGRSAIGAISVALGFGIAATAISWVGRAVFNSGVTFWGLVRALGLTYVWRVVGLVGILGLSSSLAWLMASGRLLGALLGLVAWMTAAKEALGLRWDQTVVTVFLGWAVLMVMMSGMGLLLLGVNAALSGGLFGF